MIDGADLSKRLTHNRAEAHIAYDNVLRAKVGELLGLLRAMNQGPDPMALTAEGLDHGPACLSRCAGDKNHGTLPVASPDRD
jgi:hypothetical protein